MILISFKLVARRKITDQINRTNKITTQEETWTIITTKMDRMEERITTTITIIT